MKKLALTLALALAVAAFAGCTSAPSSAPSSAPGSSTPASEPASEPVSEPASGDVDLAASSLEQIMDAVLASASQDELPDLLPADANGGSKYTPLTEENSEYNLGVARDRYVEGIAADAAMSAIPHSVCLVRAASAEEAEALAADIEANANPRKWVCVEAEKKIVEQSGDVVILIMTSSDLADQLAAGFNALAQ